jgi:hypothetical protein
MLPFDWQCDAMYTKAVQLKNWEEDPMEKQKNRQKQRKRRK